MNGLTLLTKHLQLTVPIGEQCPLSIDFDNTGGAAVIVTISLDSLTVNGKTIIPSLYAQGSTNDTVENVAFLAHKSLDMWQDKQVVRNGADGYDVERLMKKYNLKVKSDFLNWATSPTPFITELDDDFFNELKISKPL